MGTHSLSTAQTLRLTRSANRQHTHASDCTKLPYSPCRVAWQVRGALTLKGLARCSTWLLYFHLTLPLTICLLLCDTTTPGTWAAPALDQWTSSSRISITWRNALLHPRSSCVRNLKTQIVASPHTKILQCCSNVAPPPGPAGRE